MAGARQANLPWPCALMSIGNLVPMPNRQHRSRLLRFIQDMRNFNIPNHTDLCEALNWYNCKDNAQTTAGVHSYIHRRVLDIPRSHEPLPQSLNVLLPTVVAKDLSLPWIPMSNPGMHVRNGSNRAPKYRFVFFIYRHRPTLGYNPLLAANMNNPEVVYTMSYWDRENPGNMIWVDFKDEPQVDRTNRFADLQRFWTNAAVGPDIGPRLWFVDPRWYNVLARHPFTLPATTNTAWAQLEQIHSPIVQTLSLFSVISAIISMTNNIYVLAGTPAGQPTPTPDIQDDVPHLTGLHMTLIPELFCAVLHCLRADHNGAFNHGIVRNQANLPVVGPNGLGFGLLDPQWVWNHLSLTQQANHRHYRHQVRLALMTVPGRLAAPGAYPNIDQFPDWYETALI